MKALLPYPVGRVGGQRYRIEQWRPHLERAGVDVTFSPFLSERGLDALYRPGHAVTKAAETVRGYLRRALEAARGDKADVIYVFREAALLGPPWLERWHAARHPIVFDFDDAIYLPDASAANPWTRLLKPRGKAETICRLAHGVIAGNEVLAGFARAHAARVSVVPSTVDTEVYRVGPRPSNPRPVIGWTGSLTTLPHLALAAPALRRLHARIPFVLKVVGGSIDLPGLETHCVPWRAETEVEELASLDVGIMPLPDDEWSRGKCGMKALQYMALAIPPVVSPVGANATIVSHGVNGLHARTDDEWVEALAALLQDSSLRARLGTAARRAVEDGYSSQVQAPRVAEVLRAAAG